MFGAGPRTVSITTDLLDFFSAEIGEVLNQFIDVLAALGIGFVEDFVVSADLESILFDLASTSDPALIV